MSNPVMLFAKTNLKFADTYVPAKGRIPDACLRPGDREQLLKDGHAEEIAVDLTPAAPVVPPKPVPPVKNWNFKLEAIKDKTLDQLNMLIQQHAQVSGLAQPPAFKDKEEAILFLMGE